MFRPLMAASLIVSASASALAQETPATQPTLSLSATAEVQIEPEFATVRSGVVVTAPTAQAAVRENAQMMNAVFTALRREGVDRLRVLRGLGPSSAAPGRSARALRAGLS